MKTFRQFNESMPDGFDAFDVFDDITPESSPSPENAERDRMYKFLYDLKVGDRIKVGAAVFTLWKNTHGPIFQKAGTSGSKLYTAHWNADKTLSMFQITGSGAPIDPAVATAVPSKL